MKKLAILFAALVASVTSGVPSGLAFANNIHDGTREAILATQTNPVLAPLFVANTKGSTQVIIAHQPISLSWDKGAAISSADTPFHAVAPIAMAAVTAEVTYEPKFPNLALPIISYEWTISGVQNTASMVSCTV